MARIGTPAGEHDAIEMMITSPSTPCDPWPRSQLCWRESAPQDHREDRIWIGVPRFERGKGVVTGSDCVYRLIVGDDDFLHTSAVAQGERWETLLMRGKMYMA